MSEERTIIKAIDTTVINLERWKITKLTYDGSMMMERDMQFLNDSTGFIVGDLGSIYKTSNGGRTWLKRKSGTLLNLLSVCFINEKIGFVSSLSHNERGNPAGCLLLKTTDGGENWSSTFFPDFNRITSLKFFTKDIGVALIFKPDPKEDLKVYTGTTSDGGMNWNLTYLPVQYLNTN
jgi:hypothetical protein